MRRPWRSPHPFPSPQNPRRTEETGVPEGHVIWGPAASPRPPPGHPGNKVPGPHFGRARMPISVALYRSLPLVPSVPWADLGPRISRFPATQPGFLAPCPEFPFGVLLQEKGATPPSL